MSTPLLVGAASSLLGGHLKPEEAVIPLSNQRDWWAWWTVWLGVCLLAWLGNPTPASFRTHLTSLSFYTHLRRLSSPSRSPNSTSTTNKPTPNAKPSDNAPSHVLSFSNRISLSVRTPPYTLRSYFFFSIVIMSPPPPSLDAALSSAKAQRAARAAGRTVDEEGGESPLLLDKSEQEIWVGAFGRWYSWKGWSQQGEEGEEEERRGRLRRGVKGMEREDHLAAVETTTVDPEPATPTTSDPTDSNEPPLSPTSRSSAAATTNRNPRSNKRVFRAGQRRASPNSLARLRTKNESANSTANNSTNPSTASSACATPPSGSVEGQHSKAASEDWDATVRDTGRSAGSTAGKGHPPLPGHFDLRGSGSGDGDGATTTTTAEDDATDDPVLVELKMQVEELKTATAENESRLQDELEVLRGKKKEEDQFRAELKAKTKVLEEQKRVADLRRVEAERELGERRSAMRGVQERVDRVKSEIGKIEKRELEVEEKKEKKKRDRREREKKLREDVGKKKEELKGVEEGVEELLEKVRGLERSVESKREVLLNKRNEMTARSMGFGAYGGGMPGGMGMAGAQAFRRTPGPLSAPFGHMHGMTGPGNNSRPSSIRSGYGGNHAYASAPSSPTLAAHPVPVSPLDDSASYSDAATKFYGGAFAPEPYRSSANHSQQGFLEHRLQHRRAEQLVDGLIQPTNLTSTLPSADDIPTSFLPFDFDANDLSPFGPGSSTRPSSLCAHDDANGTGSGATRSRPQLALPLQYLDSGLLASSESPGLEGPLSPMTPHQTSLIPSQLFQMLDEDEEDEFVMPDSPTFGAGNRDEWKGLGLDVEDDADLSATVKGKKSVGGSAGGSAGGSKEGSEAGSDGRKRDDSLSPRVLSPISPVSAHSHHSDTASPRPHPSLLSTNNLAASADTASPSPTSAVVPPAFSPWDSTDQLLSHRLSPQEDDLPRAGLSLNPDAKAFAFQPRASPTSSLPPSAIGHGVRSASSSSSNGGASSPTTGAFNSIIGPPVKSRMEFSSTNGAPSAHPLGHATTSSGSRFDFNNWQKAPSPVVAPATSTTTSAAPSASAFDPFNDELLGPLKK
ncbi:hypothetical protein BCR35DRAFT_300872 [Leucosporidium creatinivorum]|uniref:Proteophosphoglycan ppg4 n=1 Tax=Leucosporidium creatinivorum TaxID=106004 RepID=A0A1Y2G091_9BASI|nr:hypothetical protein BCR35DRAFT_300872 [Leucosporidium creatinivorum]